MSKVDPNSGIVNFRALELANEHRNAYGLRYNDFNRYRNHCANRTHRLRSSLKMTHSNGKGREFKKLPPLTLDNIKEGHLQLLLFESERAWAYSQELQAEASNPSKPEKAGKIRHSATGRFRRSIHWCTQLLSHCQSLHNAQRLSAESLVDVTAYTFTLSGRFLRYRDEYHDALAQLCVARDLLNKLESTANSSRDQALATRFADEISPEIRYCAHQMGNSKAYEVDSIVKSVALKSASELVLNYEKLVKQLVSEGHTKRGTAGHQRLQPLLWEGEEIPVRNPEIVDVLFRVQKAEADLKASSGGRASSSSAPSNNAHHNKSRKGVAAFDAVLAALSDAEDIARRLAEAQQASGSSSATAGTRDIQFLHAFIVYQLLSCRIQRDLLLISALVDSSTPKKTEGKGKTQKDVQDARLNPPVVKLLDSVLQSLTQMRALAIVEENPDLSNSVEARLAFTKAKRCLFLSHSYVAVKQYAQGLVLAQRAKLYSREASSLLGSSHDPIIESETPFYPLIDETVTTLETAIVEDETRFKQDWFAFNGGQATNERDSSRKPLFFDIALNYVQLDMERLQERAGVASPNKASAAPSSVMKDMKSNVGGPVPRAKAEEINRPASPDPSASTAKGGLSSLLGGWWGRK